MAECKDIDRALAELGRKIDAQVQCCQENKRAIADLNNRLGRLERGRASNPQRDRPQDLTEILRRLSKAEKDILDTGGILKNIIDDIKDIIDSINEHNEISNESKNIFEKILNFFGANDED